MEERTVKRLKDGLELLEIQTAKISKLKKEFELSIEGQVKIKKNLENEITIIKISLTAEALEEFKETGEKKLLGGIGIREGSTLSYPADKALEFAKEKGMFLSLDKKSFDKVAGDLGLPFVITGTKTTVTFPKVVKL